MRLRWPAVIAIGGLLGVMALVRAVVAEPLRISSESMEPTLRRGDSVLVRKLGISDLRRGDLVTFTSPAGGELALKRIVGLAGDTVVIADGVLSVNGRVLPEPYVDPAAVDAVYYGPVRVPPGELLLFGDNRERSIDSRAYGTVKRSRVRGTVVARLWPWQTFG